MFHRLNRCYHDDPWQLSKHFYIEEYIDNIVAYIWYQNKKIIYSDGWAQYST
jgi:hypothetical protein